MKVLINIRGCNGSGKSTIPLSMMDDPGMYVVDLKKGWKLTVFPTYRWVALGTYFNKTGGMDTISRNAQKFEALEYAWTKFPDFDVLMEGIIDSTIRSTYINLFTEYERRVEAEEINPRKIIVLNLVPPVEVAIERVKARNGGKPVKEDQIKSKWRSVDKNVNHFREAGFLSLRFDTTRVKKDGMLRKFLKIADRYRGDEDER